jgi:transcriptional regulator with XRE-family HTH domain
MTLLDFARMPEHTRLKLEVVASGKRLYQVAHDAGVEETRLSRILNGQREAKADELERIRRAIDAA